MKTSCSLYLQPNALKTEYFFTASHRNPVFHKGVYGGVMLAALCRCHPAWCRLIKTRTKRINYVVYWSLKCSRTVLERPVMVSVAFSSHARILREDFLVYHSKRVFVVVVVVVVSVEISSRTPIPLFKPGSDHSGSVSEDDCGRAHSDELRVSLFP